jgi:aspartate/methionine/tyrosine aminotransferase
VLLQEWLTKEKHFELNRSEGTPFVYLTLPNEINSFEFCKLLLKEQQTLVMPAEVFNDQKRAFT